MRVIKMFIAFLFLFCVLSLTVVLSAFATTRTLIKEESAKLTATQEATRVETVQPVFLNIEKEEKEKEEYIPRTDAPSEESEYYYSDINDFYRDGYGMPNCTCYAFGRAYELKKEKPELCLDDACEWYEYNKQNEFYKYGREPKLGAIACWGYKDGGAGHVAVVEKIEDDTVYCSNSAWGGANFYVDSFPADNPEFASKNLIFHGYIYVLE